MANKKFDGANSGEKKTLKIRWAVKKVKNTARVCMMYCFSACSIHQN